MESKGLPEVPQGEGLPQGELVGMGSGGGVKVLETLQATINYWSFLLCCNEDSACFQALLRSEAASVKLSVQT